MVRWPSMIVRAGVVIPLEMGIDAKPFATLNKISSVETGAPAAPRDKKGLSLLSGFLHFK